MSLNCFSQTGTNKSVSIDTTKVVISQDIARQIAKDLIRLDGCVEELKLTQDKVILLEKKDSINTSTINLMVQKDTNNQVIIIKQQDQIGVLQEEVKSLKKDVRRSKFENVIYKVTTIVGAIAVSFLLITN